MPSAAPTLPPAPSSEAHGVYVHIPFCTRKCAYCDFGSVTDTSLLSPYLQALVREIFSYPKGTPVDTIYLGGGTPSLLAPHQIEDILSAIYTHFQVSEQAEITMEVNPASGAKAYLQDLQTIGINRLSIGVQSFTDQVLTFLGRIHSAKEAMDTLKEALQLFENVGIDLIYGYPEHTIDDWQDTLYKALHFSPHHISAYQLTYAYGTPFGRDKENNILIPLHENLEATLFLETHRILEKHQMPGYEISNFAADAFRSRHNQKYWDGSSYWGFGPFAHSFEEHRWWNVGNVKDYIERLLLGKSPVEESDHRDVEQRWIEIVALRLRTKEGLKWNDYPTYTKGKMPPSWQEVCGELVQQKLARVQEDGISLPPAGWLLTDAIAQQLTDLPLP